MKLNRQQQSVFNYLLAHPGSTARDITNATFVDARARMSEIRTLHKQHGLDNPFKEVGEVKYGNNKPFKKYALETPQTAEEWWDEPSSKQQV